ncbi:MAG TPA: hypothetical protein VK427_13680 [Kofleriaceae bacterium]|nr:hypothetical protein [Kofleriaceae bacterium]
MGNYLPGLAAALCLLAACDTKATASDPQGGAAPRAEAKGREYESCGATLHCGEHLRCFDNTCRRTARSAVGDYYAAVAGSALRRGETDVAIASYAQALNQYEAEKVAGGVPPELDCAYGAALATGKAKKENAELAARVLHRCVLAVPVGSTLRSEALAQLATLEGSGLDPLLLGAAKTADLYLTKAARPSAEKLVVTVTATPEPKKSFAAIRDKLMSADVRPGLVACWEAAKQESLAVTLGVKSAYIESEYEDDPGAFAVKVEAPTSVDGTEACVRGIVEPALKATKMSDSFTTKLAITIK